MLFCTNGHNGELADFIFSFLFRGVVVKQQKIIWSQPWGLKSKIKVRAGMVLLKPILLWLVAGRLLPVSSHNLSPVGVHISTEILKLRMTQPKMCE